mmetsp:Transcript_1213/g.3073  ORF Transcript_1213/g.3073 Transcript_1213/m.3073 type:complete len:232 (+) Transcript_1213:125-820(+)
MLEMAWHGMSSLAVVRFICFSRRCCCPVLFYSFLPCFVVVSSTTNSTPIINKNNNHTTGVYYSAGSRMWLGVDRAISSSSSFMSASMLAKSGVDRYRSPVSGSMQTIVDPSSAFLAVSRAAQTVAPPEIPVRIPSRLARAWAVATAAPSGIATYSSMSLVSRLSPCSNTRGMKSGVQPWTGWAAKAGWDPSGDPSSLRLVAIPESIRAATAGSASTILVSGECSLRYLPVP